MNLELFTNSQTNLHMTSDCDKWGWIMVGESSFNSDLISRITNGNIKLKGDLEKI